MKVLTKAVIVSLFLMLLYPAAASLGDAGGVKVAAAEKNGPKDKGKEEKDRGKPTKPEHPAKPGTPEPEKPKPEDPAKPGKPSDPEKPKPEDPAKPGKPAEPEKPKPEDPAKPGTPTEPEKPQPEDPAKPGTPAEPEKPQPEKPTKPEKPQPHKPKPQKPSKPKKDKTAPVTTVDIQSAVPQKDGWYSSDVTITFTAKDDNSGVKKTKYRVNGMEWWNYTKPHVVSHDGVYTFEYRSVDNKGNKEKIQSFTIKFDKNGPEIKGAANKTIQAGSKFNPLAGVSAYDVIDHDRTSFIKVAGYVNTKKAGTYKLVYTVSDKFGHVTTIERWITVAKDKVKPVIKGAKNKTIRKHSHFNKKAGVTAYDNVDGNLTKKIKIKGNVNTKKRGVYKITYTVSDKSGNKTTVTRKITVK